MNVHQLACLVPGPREPGLPRVRGKEPAGAAGVLVVMPKVGGDALGKEGA